MHFTKSVWLFNIKEFLFYYKNCITAVLSLELVAILSPLGEKATLKTYSVCYFKVYSIYLVRISYIMTFLSAEAVANLLPSREKAIEKT